MKFWPVIICWTVVSCTPGELPHEELVQYLADPEHGLTKEEVMGEVKVTVRYRPSDLLVWQEAGGRLTQTVVDSLRKKYANKYYFTIGFSVKDREALHMTGDYGRYSDLLQTLSFRLGEYVRLTSPAGDTTELLDYAMDRTFGFASSTNLLMVFDASKISPEADFIQIHMNEFGLQTGNQVFRFATDDLVNCPKLLID
ncbi:MAG: hypothetical protein ACK5DD_00710 [Cyclobacteriaceae bacterium]|jgi:hypothetical protein